MARIRTIKPEFFTSEDIVSLSPFARLLYIALWCESDKEGRMQWKPKTFKMRYFPADDVEIYKLCLELLSARLVLRYGDDLDFAYIPQFGKHQHVNPRESASSLPDPSEELTRAPRVGTRECTVTDAQVGREGKGREGNEEEKEINPPLPSVVAPPATPDHPVKAETPKAPRPSKKCPDLFEIDDGMVAWAKATVPAVSVSDETAKFRDHTFATACTDWAGRWRNWLRKAAEMRPINGSAHGPPGPALTVPSGSADHTRAYLEAQRKTPEQAAAAELARQAAMQKLRQARAMQ